MYFPYLPAIEFYERADFPWLDSIEAATDDIRAELVNVLADGPDATLEPYVTLSATAPLDQWRELNHSRRWGLLPVARGRRISGTPRAVPAYRRGARGVARDATCPAPRLRRYFPILDARTRIPPHTGVSNTRLISSSAVDHPTRLWFQGRRRTARMGPRESLCIRRHDGARGLE